MTDFSTMSDSDLMALIKPQAPTDYSKMSDDDLKKIIGASKVVAPSEQVNQDMLGNPMTPYQTSPTTQGNVEDIKQDASKFAIPPGMAAQKATEGIPILSPYLDKAKAAIDAASTGIANTTGLSKIDQSAGYKNPFSSAPDFSQRYAENLATTQAQSKQGQEQYPYGSNISKVAGNAAVMGPLIAGMPGAFGLGAGSLPVRTGIGAMTSGTIGGIDAAARGENIPQGAMIGAGIGGVVPVVGSAIGKIAQAVIGKGNGLLSDVNPMAIDWAKKALIADGATPQIVEDQFNKMGPQAFLAEFGPNTQGITSAAAGMPGQGKTNIIQGFKTRAAQEGGVISKSLDDAFGPATNVPKYIEFMEKARKEAADPAYKAFRNTEVPMTPQLEAVLSRPSVKEAMPAAARLAEDEGRPIVSEAGNPTAETYDYIKRALDDKARAAGFGTNQARIITGLKRDLTSAIDNHPDPNVAGVWKEARQGFSDRSSILDALEQGEGWRKIHKDELPMLIEGYSGPEKQAFMQGMRSDINDIAEATKRGDTRSRDLFLATSNQEKAKTLIGDAKAAELVKSMGNAADRASNTTQIIGNSLTEPRRQMGKMITPDPSQTITSRLKNAYSPEVTPGVLIPKALENSATAKQAAKYESARNDLAKILMQQGPEANKYAQALLAPKTAASNNVLVGKIAAMLAQQARPGQ